MNIISKKPKGFSVNASPFNPVKLELGVILIIGMTLVLVVERISPRGGLQVLILLGYALASAAWLMWRIVRTQRALGVPDGQEKQQ
ncbi:MAG: hypothetical protein OEW08_11070 [Gammaproteobacteria bacterium]|nr:hypothetical protein [Gammaproteobacteria bacterium]